MKYEEQNKFMSTERRTLVKQNKVTSLESNKSHSILVIFVLCLNKSISTLFLLGLPSAPGPILRQDHLSVNEAFTESNLVQNYGIIRYFFTRHPGYCRAFFHVCLRIFFNKNEGRRP